VSHIRSRFCFTLIAIFSLCAAGNLFAQEDLEKASRKGSRIIDDSTRQIYGPTTSQWFTRDDLFLDSWKTYPIDTVSENFHWFDFNPKYQNNFQDLGNIGTAAQPVMQPVLQTIGATSGFSTYDLYWNDWNVNYFNTRSPYSNMNVILGGKGRSLTNITYTRNITPTWNFGFDYHGLFIDKQVQRSGKGDRNVRSNDYDLFMSYHTRDSAYAVLGSFRRMFHRVSEYGGVKPTDEYRVSDLFEQNAQPWLTEAESNDLRRGYFLYHQYRLNRGFQVYHQLQSDRQRNQFLDNLDQEINGDEFFDAIVVDSAETHDEVRFNAMRNDVGVKGNLSRLFYNGFVGFRNFSMEYKYLNEEFLEVPASGNEWYVGGSMFIDLDSLLRIGGNAEWMLDNRYKINAELKTKWVEATLSRAVTTPAFVHQAYRGSHDQWLNDFTETEASRLWGALHYRSRVLRISPGVALATWRNLIFFKKGNYGGDQTVLPIQSSGYQTVLNPELRISVWPVKHLQVSAFGIYAKVLENADDALQIPEWFVNAQVAYSNIWFNGNFDFQIGVDLHWKSAYFAYGYDPAIQQFYQQREIQAPDFPVMDVFFNAKIIRGRIFLRYHNLLKAFLSSGNVPTPYYPGVQNVLDFGFDWSFYD
jgi:hypothetical protein